MRTERKEKEGLVSLNDEIWKSSTSKDLGGKEERAKQPRRSEERKVECFHAQRGIN